MVKAAVGGVPGLEASRLEIERGGPSYTADTVAQLAAEAPGAELFVIVGWDVSAELGTWERLDEVRELASLVVVNRPGTPPPVGLRQLGWRLEEVSVPNLEISSTDLRARRPAGARWTTSSPRRRSASSASVGCTLEVDDHCPRGRPEQLGVHARHGAAKRPGRRQRAREKVLAALVLFVAFAVTVVLLGLQWLGNQGNSSAAPVTSHTLISEVQPT